MHCTRARLEILLYICAGKTLRSLFPTLGEGATLKFKGYRRRRGLHTGLLVWLDLMWGNFAFNHYMNFHRLYTFGIPL